MIMTSDNKYIRSFEYKHNDRIAYFTYPFSAAAAASASFSAAKDTANANTTNRKKIYTYTKID
jgi:hypothetical protein